MKSSFYQTDRKRHFYSCGIAKTPQAKKKKKRDSLILSQLFQENWKKKRAKRDEGLTGMKVEMRGGADDPNCWLKDENR